MTTRRIVACFLPYWARWLEWHGSCESIGILAGFRRSAPLTTLATHSIQAVYKRTIGQGRGTQMIQQL
jgi:hypothetical protein